MTLIFGGDSIVGFATPQLMNTIYNLVSNPSAGDLSYFQSILSYHCWGIAQLGLKRNSSLFEGPPIVFLYWKYFKGKLSLPSKALQHFGERKALWSAVMQKHPIFCLKNQTRVRGLEGSHKNNGRAYSYFSIFSTLSWHSKTNIWLFPFISEDFAM